MAETASWFRIPRTRKSSGFWAFCITAVSVAAVLWFGPHLESVYFLALLIALPTSAGLLATLIYGYTELRSYEECLRASVWALAWFYLTFLLLAVLGLPLLAHYILNIIYLSAVFYAVVAVPFAIVLAALGGTLGYCIQRAAPRKSVQTSLVPEA